MQSTYGAGRVAHAWRCRTRIIFRLRDNSLSIAQVKNRLGGGENMRRYPQYFLIITILLAACASESPSSRPAAEAPSSVSNASETEDQPEEMSSEETESSESPDNLVTFEGYVIGPYRVGGQEQGYWVLVRDVLSGRFSYPFQEEFGMYVPVVMENCSEPDLQLGDSAIVIGMWKGEEFSACGVGSSIEKTGSEDPGHVMHIYATYQSVGNESYRVKVEEVLFGPQELVGQEIDVSRDATMILRDGYRGRPESGMLVEIYGQPRLTTTSGTWAIWMLHYPVP